MRSIVVCLVLMGTLALAAEPSQRAVVASIHDASRDLARVDLEGCHPDSGEGCGDYRLLVERRAQPGTLRRQLSLETSLLLHELLFELGRNDYTVSVRPNPFPCRMLPAFYEPVLFVARATLDERAHVVRRSFDAVLGDEDCARPRAVVPSSGEAHARARALKLVLAVLGEETAADGAR